MSRSLRSLPLLLTAALLVPATAHAQTAPAATPATAPATTPSTTTSTRKTKTPKAAQPLPTGIIHINSAPLADLLKLPGVTATVTDNIVQNRPYRTVAELVKKVRGIGPRNVLKLQPYIDFQ